MSDMTGEIEKIFKSFDDTETVTRPIYNGYDDTPLFTHNCLKEYFKAGYQAAMEEMNRYKRIVDEMHHVRGKE